MKRILVSLLAVFILLIGLLGIRFGSALSQEGNPLPILSSILDLELSDSEYEQFAESETQNRYVSANSGENRYQVITEFLNDKGWDFDEQLGSGFVFKKGDESLVIESKLYSKHYFLWDVPGEVFD